MEEKYDKQNNTTFGLLAVLLGTGTLIGRNAQLYRVRTVDKLLLISFGVILGTLITRFILLKKR